MAEILNINSGNTFTTGFQTQAHHGVRGMPKIILYPQLLGFLLGTGKHKSRAKRYTFGERLRQVKHIDLHERKGKKGHGSLHDEIKRDIKAYRQRKKAREALK